MFITGSYFYALRIMNLFQDFSKLKVFKLLISRTPKDHQNSRMGLMILPAFMSARASANFSTG